jgi:hypothetical protein
MSPVRTGNSQSPADPRQEIPNFPNRFRLSYRDPPNGTYKVQDRYGADLFDLDGLLGTDQNVLVPPPFDVNFTPERIECRRRINASNGPKRVGDYECEYRDGGGNDRTIRLADMVFVAFDPAPGQPDNGYYPPA